MQMRNYCVILFTKKTRKRFCANATQKRTKANGNLYCVMYTSAFNNSNLSSILELIISQTYRKSSSFFSLIFNATSGFDNFI